MEMHSSGDLRSLLLKEKIVEEDQPESDPKGIGAA